MPFSIRNYNDYKTYFEGLATSHVDIQSFVYNEDENLANQLRSGDQGKPPIMWLEAYELRVNDELSDNYIGNATGALAIIQKISDDMPADQAERQCEEIVTQLMSKMQLDHQNGEITAQFNAFSYATIDPVFADRLRGVRLQFNFFIPLNLAYDEDKWQ